MLLKQHNQSKIRSAQCKTSSACDNSTCFVGYTLQDYTSPIKNVTVVGQGSKGMSGNLLEGQEKSGKLEIFWKK